MSDNFSNEPEELEMQDRELLGLLDEIKIRIGDEPGDLDLPPADLWADIAASVDSDFHEPRSAGLVSEQNVVTSLDHHRRRRRPAGALLAAVAASVVAAIVLGSVLTGGDSVIDTVDLVALGDGSSFGTATVVEEGGTTRLDIDLKQAVTLEDDEFLELWIIDTEVQGMYSLGRIADDGSFSVPEGVDVKDFPIIDISVEEDDGNDAHSGNSAYRGQLDA